MAGKTENCLHSTELVQPMSVTSFVDFQITTIPGGSVDNKANSVQLQLQLPTGTELGKNHFLAAFWIQSIALR